MDKVVLLINKTTNHFGNKPVKFFTVSNIFLSVVLTGCSIAPVQKAGSQALREAYCLYEKKIDYKSSDFEKCLSDLRN